MKYRPHWQRIFFLAVILNCILFFSGYKIFSSPIIKQTPPEDLPEIEWIEVETTSNISPNLEMPPSEIFPEIVMPELEIPHTEFEPLPQINVEPSTKPVEKSPETKSETKTEVPEKKPQEKKVEDPASKLKVISKIYPKNLIEEFLKLGISEEDIKHNKQKITVSVTIGFDGKVKPESAKIIVGTANPTINFLAVTAASSWIFEPYLDPEGNPQELKTQIEFNPEDC